MSSTAAEVAVALLAELQDPVVLIDGAGRVTWSNRTARAIGAVEGGEMGLLLPKWLAEPMAVLAAQARDQPGPAQITVVSGPDNARSELCAVARGRLVALLWRAVGDTDRAAADCERTSIKLDLLLDMIPAAVWVAHDSAGARLTVNRQGAEWLRLRRADNASLSAPAPERPRHFRIERDGVAVSAEQLPMQRAARGEVVSNEELRVVFEDGGYYDELFSARPLRDAAGRLIGAVGAAIDISSRRRAEEALRRSEERFRDFALSVSDWMWETDAEHRFVWMSPNVEELTGVPPEWHYGKTRLELMAPSTDPAVMAEHLAVLSRREPFRDLEFLRRGPNGDTWLSTSGVPVFDQQGRFQGYRGVARVVTARKEAEARIRSLVHQDSLTGLGNRRLLFDRLEPAIALARRQQRRGALLLLDLDGFKSVNDRLGHVAGDRLLIQVGRRLTDALRQSDTLVRLGGDEFAILQPEVMHPGQAVALAERIVASLARPFDLAREAVSVGCSVGIALFPNDGRSADQVVRNADLALYRAKAEGGDRYRLFEQAMDLAVRKRRRVARDIQDALSHDRLQVTLAPVRDLRTGDVVSGEIGVRWQRSDGRAADVGRFIDDATPRALVTALDAWAIKQACAIARNAGRDRRPRRVIVPLRSKRLGGSGVGALVRQQLAADPWLVDRCELAVPGAALLHADDDAVLNELASLGIALTLYSDECGMGCTVTRFAALPFGRLVVDLSEVGAGFDRRALGASLRAAQVAASALGRSVAARGVTRVGDERLLRALGYDTVQGAVGGRPVPEDAFSDLLCTGVLPR